MPIPSRWAGQKRSQNNPGNSSKSQVCFVFALRFVVVVVVVNL